MCQSHGILTLGISEPQLKRVWFCSLLIVLFVDCTYYIKHRKPPLIKANEEFIALKIQGKVGFALLRMLNLIKKD